MARQELDDFLKSQCKERGLTLRGLSVKAGLSPSTVHNLIKREYHPTLFTLNSLADYLGVKRQYIWQLAGILEDMDYGAGEELSDPRLKAQFARTDKLPEPLRELAIDMLKAIENFSKKLSRLKSKPEAD